MKCLSELGSVVALMRIPSLFHLSSCFLSPQRKTPPDLSLFSLFTLPSDKIKCPSLSQQHLSYLPAVPWSGASLAHTANPSLSNIAGQLRIQIVEQKQPGFKSLINVFYALGQITPLSFSFFSYKISLVIACRLQGCWKNKKKIIHIKSQIQHASHFINIQDAITIITACQHYLFTLMNS